MCGIFGVIAKKEAGYSSSFIRKSLNVLANESQSRGKDSSGLLFVDDLGRSYKVIKGAIPLNSLRADTIVKSQLEHSLKAYNKEGQNHFISMGHSRLVTNGTQFNDDNNQPVIKNNIICVHNGIIVNDAQLWADNKDLARQYEIDTEVMLALIDKHLREGHDVIASIELMESEIKGTVSTALIFPEFSSLVLYTNNGSLYAMTNETDLLFFASEFNPLQVLARKMNLDTGSAFTIHKLTKEHSVILNFDPFEIRKIENYNRPMDLPGLQGNTRKNYTILVNSVKSNKPQLELVSDVALIASAPEAANFEAMLEFNHDRVAKLRRCSRCLLPETFPFIIYDDQGVCIYCNNYKIKNQPKPNEELLNLIEPYRSKDGKPDCIVPFSGGRDSTYALHIIKTKLGLNPIAFTYDWGMVTDLGRRNIARVCGKLGVENIIVAADIHWKRSNIRKNLNAWLQKPHLGMIPLFMAGDKYFYYFIERVKRQTGISLNLWGINPMENTDFKVGFMGVEPDFEKKHIYSLSANRQLKLITGVVKAVLSNPRYINSSVLDTMGSFFSRSIMPHKDYFHLFDYFRWDEQEIDHLLHHEYSWETAIDTKTTWRIGDGTAAMYNYIYFTVAGFSEHDTFRSNQIREGMMTREEGLRLINEENHPRYPTIKWYSDAVGLDYEHTIKVINNIPKLY